GAVLAARLSPAVEARPHQASAPGPAARARSRLGPSRAVVRRLAGLFAVDAAGGGLVTTGFLSYYLAERYHASVVALGRPVCAAPLGLASGTGAPSPGAADGAATTASPGEPS